MAEVKHITTKITPTNQLEARCQHCGKAVRIQIGEQGEHWRHFFKLFEKEHQNCKDTRTPLS